MTGRVASGVACLGPDPQPRGLGGGLVGTGPPAGGPRGRWPWDRTPSRRASGAVAVGPDPEPKGLGGPEALAAVGRRRTCEDLRGRAPPSGGGCIRSLWVLNPRIPNLDRERSVCTLPLWRRNAGRRGRRPAPLAPECQPEGSATGSRGAGLPVEAAIDRLPWGRNAAGAGDRPAPRAPECRSGGPPTGSRGAPPPAGRAHDRGPAPRPPGRPGR
jgi:hypothetical protein